MAEDFSKSRAAPPAAGELRGARAYEPPPAGWRPGKTNSPLTGERADSRGPAPPPPPPPRAYPPAPPGGLAFAHSLSGLPLPHLMPHWVPPPGSRAGLYPLPGAPAPHPAAAAEELMQQQQRLLAQHRQQQQQQAQQPPPLSREAAEKQQREAAEKQQQQQREATEKQQQQQREAVERQRQEEERQRQDEERKKQHQAVSQHFAESMRRMQQKGRLAGAPPVSASGLHGAPAPPIARYGDLRPGPGPGPGPVDGSSEPERIIRDSIHRLYQSTEPAVTGHKPEPGPAGRPGYLTYFDHLKGVPMHPAKPPPPPLPQAPQPPPPADRHSPYLPPALPGQPSYKGALPHPPHGRSPAPAESRLPPPPPPPHRPVPAHGSERSSSPYLPPAPAPAPPLQPHRSVYSPPAGLLGGASVGLPPPPAHGGRRAATPPAHHQTLDLSVGSRAAQSGCESPKRPASTPGLNLGMSPAKRARPEPALPPPPLSRPDEPLALVASASRLGRASPVPPPPPPPPAVVARDAWQAPPAPVPPPPPPAVISSASAPASGASSPAPADVAVKVEPADTRPSYTHKLKKKWLQRLAGDDAESTSSGVNGAADTAAQLSNGSVEGAKPPVKVSPPTSVKSEPAEPEAAASPAPPPPAATAAAATAAAAPPSSAPSSPAAAETKSAVAVTVNGDGDTDSSDGSPPAKRRPAPRRKPPKKAALELSPATPARDAKKQKASDGSDSDSEKGSEEEAAPARDARRQDAKSAKKRGRRTKDKPAKAPKRAAKPEKKESSPPKKVDAFKRPSISKLKKSGANFLQDSFCRDLSSKLPKCRECRIKQGQRSPRLSDIYCRFLSFRLLRYTKSGVLTVAGFCDPEKDADEEDTRLWLPAGPAPPPPLVSPAMTAEVARLLVADAGGAFCQLAGGERQAARGHMSANKTVAWKRVVQACREMCDVCETTLFNVHWVCSKCGFAVCMDCYRGRREGSARAGGEPGRDRDRFQWLLCSSRQPHDQQRLMLTQIVTGDALGLLSERVHEARLQAGLPLSCQCEAARRLQPAGAATAAAEGATAANTTSTSAATTITAAAGELANGARHKMEDYDGGEQGDKKGSPLTWLADVALSDSKKNSDVSNSESEPEADGEDGTSTLRTLLMRPDGSQLQEKPGKKERGKGAAGAAIAALDEALEKAVSPAGQAADPAAGQPELKYFVRREEESAAAVSVAAAARPGPLSAAEAQRLGADVRHSWLCDGRLLRLQEAPAAAAAAAGGRLFREQWRRGLPVLCSSAGGRPLDPQLWSAEAFARDLADERIEAVDCASGVAVPAVSARRFWDGFGDASQRPRDDAGEPRLLRLQEWLTGEDFADVMPARYADLMAALPLPEYTRRDGRLNLAGCLPDCFVQPDLGPRLCVAYGAPAAAAADGPAAATSLRLEVSDTVSLLAHVAGGAEEEQEARRAAEEAGCDGAGRRPSEDQRAAAVWHIYHAADADKIRDLLNKVSAEGGAPVEPRHDPLHDGGRYLDAPLRRRLLAEYGVRGCAVLQCAGEAVLVPAGAPHQVRHLRAAVRVAEEFVSPESVGLSFELTQQLRAAAAAGGLGHDDKRQIKNIFYHAMKDAVSVLSAARAAAAAASADGDDGDGGSSSSSSGGGGGGDGGGSGGSIGSSSSTGGGSGGGSGS